jgi:putative transposase
VLALHASAEECKEGWLSLLQDLRTRGATQLDLIVTDGHDGLLAAVGELFAATPRQRCLVHKQRNILAAIPRRERGDVQAELVGIWEQATQQEALTQLSAFKAKYGQRYRGSGAKPDGGRRASFDVLRLSARACTATSRRPMRTPSLFSNVRQRTNQIDVFTTETSCLTIGCRDDRGISACTRFRCESAEALKREESSSSPARTAGSRGNVCVRCPGPQLPGQVLFGRWLSF